MTGSLSVSILHKTISTIPRLAAIASVCAILGPTSGIAQTVKQQVRLMDYFYPKNLLAHWDYLTEKESGEFKVTRVSMNSKSSKLNVFQIRNGRLADCYKRATWMTTLRGRSSNGKLKFGSIADSHDFYGSKDNYAIYGFYSAKDHVSIRCNAVFPEKFAPKQSVSVKTALFDSEGRRGPNAVLTTQLIGKGSVTVPAGRFADCIHLRFSMAAKGIPSVTRDEWWAKGVGIVKTSAPKAEGGSRVGKLQAYDLPFEVTLDFNRRGNGGDFGRVSIETWGASINTGRTQTFQVINRGKIPISALDISIIGSNRFKCDRASIGKLAPGEMAEFFITFTPLDLIRYTAKLKVEERGNPANFQTLKLRGIGDF